MQLLYAGLRSSRCNWNIIYRDVLGLNRVLSISFASVADMYICIFNLITL